MRAIAQNRFVSDAMASELDRTRKDCPPSEEAKAPVRHVEKRRTGTCAFADRVARASLEHFRRVVPSHFRARQPQTCVATIVAHVRRRHPTARDPCDPQREEIDELVVVALGVGTKFLTEAALCSLSRSTSNYGDRVRDCHAEVLAKRAFRRRLLVEILDDLRGTSATGSQSLPSIRLLERVSTSSTLLEDQHRDHEVSVRYQLRKEVTLHLYCSSAPCGNAVLKKFCTIKGETFQTEWNSDEWPNQPHPNILPGHSQALGQFVLLCKKDSARCQASDQDNAVYRRPGSDEADTRLRRTVSAKEAAWACHSSDDWCPAGTTTVWTGRGSLHTCSDKIARWNVLGLQGSYVAPFLSNPLYLSSLVVGRKFSSITCRRAVCCRLGNQQHEPSLPSSHGSMMQVSSSSSSYQLHHPAVMGTGVYMDENGTINATRTKEVGQDVRFHSSHSWAWWPGLDMAECIDGSTGFQRSPKDEVEDESLSHICTTSLVQLSLAIQACLRGHLDVAGKVMSCTPVQVSTLALLLQFKQELSPEYEKVKETLLTRHHVLLQWNRRSRRLPTSAIPLM